MAILGLLEERELHGYEIRRQLREGLGLLANVSFGSLYPALARLEAAGAVVATEDRAEPEPPAAPPTGSLSGERAVQRARRHQRRPGPAVAQGLPRSPTRAAASSSSCWPAAPPTTPAASACGWPSPATWPPTPAWPSWSGAGPSCSSGCAEVRAATGDATLDVYARSVVEHTAEGVEQDVRWLERLIEAERQSAGPPWHRGRRDRVSNPPADRQQMHRPSAAAINPRQAGGDPR